MDAKIHREYLSAIEAADLLGIRKQTLYAYVSRGLVRSVSDGGASRSKLYLRDDLQRLRVKADARGGHEAAAATAMNLGAPIVPTHITEITPQGPRYRGHLATDLVRHRATFENVSELLWTGHLHDAPLRWPIDGAQTGVQQLSRHIPAAASRHQMMEVLALVTLQLAMGRGAVQDRLRSGKTLDATRQVILALVGCFGFYRSRPRYVPVPRCHSVAHGLLLALGHSADASSVGLIDALLVLMADHELSPGAFAARVAASAGASLHSCLAAALTVSAGSEVARLYERTNDFLDSALRADTLFRRADTLLCSGRSVPGFDHPIYPQGDPRARCLLDLLSEAAHRRSPELLKILGLVQRVEQSHGIHARHEMGVIAVCRFLGLPPQASPALFVLARIAGWVAHIQEQRLSRTLLRPRAKFVAEPFPLAE